MKLSEFRFDLPQNLIALNPTENREDARMMVVNRKNKTIEHKKFTDIIDIVEAVVQSFGSNTPTTIRDISDVSGIEQSARSKADGLIKELI